MVEGRRSGVVVFIDFANLNFRLDVVDRNFRLSALMGIGEWISRRAGGVAGLTRVVLGLVARTCCKLDILNFGNDARRYSHGEDPCCKGES